MILKTLLLVIVVYCTIIQGQDGQENCRPDSVQSIFVSGDTSLVWSPPYNNDCVTDHFLIYIRNETLELTYTVKGYRLSLDFLQVCEHYTFGVITVSAEGIEGEARETYDKVPYPIDTDLRISLFKATPRGRGIHLEWEVEEQWRKCPERFRLTIVDEETNYPLDLYVPTTSASINNVIPCGQYTFGIRAVYNLGLEGSYTTTRLQAPVDNVTAPALQNITLGNTSIDLRWQLESWLLNRCPISSLTVDGSPYFKIAYPVSDQINRPPIFVQLTGLEPDTVYPLTVTALNTAGTSPPTLLIVQTLERG